MFIPIDELPLALDSEASVNSRLRLIHRDYLLKADNKWLFSAHPWTEHLYHFLQDSENFVEEGEEWT